MEQVPEISHAHRAPSLDECFSHLNPDDGYAYNPVTGAFTVQGRPFKFHQPQPRKSRVQGDNRNALMEALHGYRRFKLRPFNDFRSHRLVDAGVLAVYLHTGREVRGNKIKYLDGNRENLRWENLQVSELPPGITTQRGYFKLMPGRIYLGTFKTLNEAIARARELNFPLDPSQWLKRQCSMAEISPLTVDIPKLSHSPADQHLLTRRNSEALSDAQRQVRAALKALQKEFEAAMRQLRANDATLDGLTARLDAAVAGQADHAKAVFKRSQAAHRRLTNAHVQDIEVATLILANLHEHQRLPAYINLLVWLTADHAARLDSLNEDLGAWRKQAGVSA